MNKEDNTNCIDSQKPIVYRTLNSYTNWKDKKHKSLNLKSLDVIECCITIKIK